MRYSGDDYCYGSEINLRGFINNQIYSYLHPMAYNGNRYSLTLFSNIGDLFGAISGALMPGLAIVFWLVGLYLMLGALGKRLHIETGWMVRLCLAEFIVFMSIYLAPYLMQDLYWRTAMLTYLAPVISFTWVVWLSLVYGNHKRGMHYLLPVICILAFISAGFSETGAALQAAALIFILLGTGLLQKADLVHRRRSLFTFGLALLIILVAMVFLAVSPSNASRINVYAHPGPLQFVRLTLTYGFTFLIDSLESYPLPTMIILIFSVALGLEISVQFPIEKRDLKKWMIVGGLIVTITYLLVAATAAPSVLARTTYPEQRAWMPGRAAMTAGLILFGLYLGIIFKGIIKPANTLQLVLFVLAILAVNAYALRSVPRIVTEARPMRDWAAGWDLRDQTIRSAIEAGETELTVDRLPVIIPYVNELVPDSGNWYNECAAGWYGLVSISAGDTP